MHKNSPTMKNVIIITLFILTALVMNLGFKLHSDEGIILNGAWNLYNGKIIYQDFFEYVPPLSFYLGFFTFSVFGPNYFALQIVSIILLLISSYIIYKTAQLLSMNETYGALCAYAWLVIASISYPLINHNAYGSYVMILFAYFFLHYLKHQKNFSAFLAGAVAALAFYFLQTKGLVLAVLLTFFFPYVYRKKMITGRALIIFTIGNYVFVILGYLLWKNEVLANFILSISGYMEIHKILYLYPAAMIGFLIFIIRPLLSKNKDNVALYLLFWLQIGLIASVMNQPDVYHLGINAFPLLILAAYSLQKSQLASKKIIYGALLVSLYAILMGNLIYIKSTGNWKMHVQHLRIFSEVKKIVKDEKIFAYPFIPQYYFFLQKQNPYYDSILLEKFSPKEHFQINLDILKKEKPKYILTQYNFTKRYGHSMNNVIDAYIRDSYVQTYSLGALEVWEKIE